MGARILKKMGWRLGQGIGPRLTYAQRKAQDAGFLDPSKEIEGDEEDVAEAKKHMYPRRDTQVMLAPRKDNFHGLGYSPGMGLNESVGYGQGGERGPGGPNISGTSRQVLVTLFDIVGLAALRIAGFGLGALNDADEDDLDVYDSGMGPSARSRVAFDSSFGDDDHHMSIGSSSLRRQGAQGPVRSHISSICGPLELTFARQESTSWYNTDLQRWHSRTEGICVVR